MSLFADLPALKVVVQVVLSAWMVAVAVSDHRRGLIPTALTGPVLLGAGVYRLAEGFGGEWVRFLLPVVWALLFLMWMAHFIGGGDAKFLMALYALFPSMEFSAVLALILLVIMVPLLVIDVRRRSGGSLRSIGRRLATGQILPTATELEEQGRRYAWTFAVPGLVYLWLYW